MILQYENHDSIKAKHFQPSQAKHPHSVATSISRSIPTLSHMYFITSLAMAKLKSIILFISLHVSFIPIVYSVGASHVCRSYCGNITIDYPFALQSGCGHSGFRDLLFCINDVLMFHISSGSYRVLNIDYAYRSMTLHDPHLSTCDSIVLGGRGNGFVVEHWRAPYLNPTPDNVFMLLGCSTQSPLFQGFPAGDHVPCRNVSGMSCEEYYGCQGWMDLGLARMGLAYWSGPLICCALPFDAIKSVNLSKLECQGYSSAYTLAPLRVSGPSEWTYGIRVKYDVEVSNDSFCKACEATGGSCGHDVERFGQLCMCGSWNSTSNCDTLMKLSVGGTSLQGDKFSGSLIVISTFWLTSFLV